MMEKPNKERAAMIKRLTDAILSGDTDNFLILTTKGDNGNVAATTTDTKQMVGLVYTIMLDDEEWRNIFVEAAKHLIK